MTRWRLETATGFDRAARKLDRAVLARIRRYLEDVCALEDPRQRGRALSGGHAGYWRYRIGDYRVIVLIEDDRLVVLAIMLGHRSEIYRR